MRRRLRRLIRCQRGGSTLELSFVAPFVILLILGVTDLSMGFAAELDLEQAAARTVERGTAAGLMGSSYDYLRAEAAAASGQPLANVTLNSWLECDGARQASFDDVCPTGQQIGRYVSISIAGTYTPMFDYSWFAQFFGGSRGMDASYPIVGDATMRVQ